MLLPEAIKPFILASGSPRRKELLELAGLKFETLHVGVDESFDTRLTPIEVVNELALRKLDACRELRATKLVITADTLVFKGPNILGKPANKQDAQRMLKFLSGTDHQVTTSVCLGYQNEVEQFHITTRVHFKPLETKIIDYYIDTYQPYDKAGSYGIQEWLGLIGIDKIEGSYTNVVGLPAAETIQAIDEVSERWQIN